MNRRQILVEHPNTLGIYIPRSEVIGGGWQRSYKTHQDVLPPEVRKYFRWKGMNRRRIPAELKSKARSAINRKTFPSGTSGYIICIVGENPGGVPKHITMYP